MTSAAALRARRARQRRARGGRIYPVELDDDEIDALVAAGHIDRSDLDDPESLAIRLGELLQKSASRVTVGKKPAVELQHQHRGKQ